jgi:hypothetical protein
LIFQVTIKIRSLIANTNTYKLIILIIIYLLKDKLDKSEAKLINLCEQKKNLVSEQIGKLIDHIRQLEDDFYSEIDEFKNNRLALV